MTAREIDGPRPGPSAAAGAARGAAACVVVIAVVLVLILSAGCRQSGPRVEMVEGVVTLDGAPAEGVMVTFHPVGPAGLLAVGTTAADGRFTLNATRGGRPGGGTAAGDYAVTLAKTKGGYEIIEGPSPQPADEPPPDIETQKAAYERWAREQQQRKPRPLPPIEYLIPKAYGEQETSGFRVSVKRGRNVGPDFRFDLRSDFGSPRGK